MEKDIIIIEKKDIIKSTQREKTDNLPKYWDKEYINQQLSGIKNHTKKHTKAHQHKMLLQFLWLTGVRVTEAISVTKQDLNFDNYTITIKWLKNRKYLTRNIPMHPRLNDMLQIYTATMKAEDRIFPITKQRVGQITREIMKGNPHKFRHSFAVNWLKQGGNIVMLSRMLGHSNVNTTMIYLRIVPSDIGKELIKINFDKEE